MMHEKLCTSAPHIIGTKNNRKLARPEEQHCIVVERLTGHRACRAAWGLAGASSCCRMYKLSGWMQSGNPTPAASKIPSAFCRSASQAVLYTYTLSWALPADHAMPAYVHVKRLLRIVAMTFIVPAAFIPSFWLRRSGDLIMRVHAKERRVLLHYQLQFALFH